MLAVTWENKDLLNAAKEFKNQSWPLNIVTIE